MRLTLKHQIILAPATVLLFLSLLLAFLQYTYWDLSVKRQEARELRTVVISLAEADLVAQRIAALALLLREEPLVGMAHIEDVGLLYGQLDRSMQRVLACDVFPKGSRNELGQIVADLDPEKGIKVGQIISSIGRLRPELSSFLDIARKNRARLGDVHDQDIDTLVTRTAFVSLVVLGGTILIGIFLSLTFARSLLRRIQGLSDCARRVARGELCPPSEPETVRDELDGLAVSIKRMTDRLIRVVGTEKLLEGAEEERRRIAMDIHDQTLADLSAVLRGIQELQGNESVRGEAKTLEDDLCRAMANLRDVMDDLHPQTLDILGLGAALESHLERHFVRDGLPECHLYVSPKVETLGLSRAVSLTLYRIAVEVMHNVIKHSGATRYEVNLDFSGSWLVLSVEDNGTGFDPEAAGIRGRGLHNIRERARAIGAEAGWGGSRFSSGTRFELTLPVATAGSGEV